MPKARQKTKGATPRRSRRGVAPTPGLSSDAAPGPSWPSVLPIPGTSSDASAGAPGPSVLPIPGLSTSAATEEPGPSVVATPGIEKDLGECRPTSQPWPVVCVAPDSDIDRGIVELSAGPGMAQQGPGNAPQLCAMPREALGSTISRALQVKIWNSEYVEMGALLKNTTVSESNAPMVLALSGSTFQLQPQRNVPRITSIEQWTSAFLVYASVFVEKHLARASEMFKYMDIVRTAARFGGYGWRAYDVQFRLRQEREPTRSWAVVDMELWLMTAAAHYVPSPSSYSGRALGRGNFRRFEQSKQLRRGGAMRSQVAGHAGRAPAGAAPGLRYCYAFNGGRCIRRPCLYAHRCQRCDQTSHGASQCTLKDRQPQESRTNSN